MKYLYYLFFLAIPFKTIAQHKGTPYIYILGIAQDGGYPHAGCERSCCTRARNDNHLEKFVVSFALVDPAAKKWWLFEATPDINRQLHLFHQYAGKDYSYLPQGIFITHAHIGHYAGLMHLGKEVMGTHGVPVYTLPKLKAFLETNGPWSQLVTLHNIALHPLQENQTLHLPGGIDVIPYEVPHRDEYSETAGFKIITPNRKYLFIPDIDKWAKWNHDIIEEVKSVNIALLDATFYRGTELPNRNMSDVPHPLVSETMELFSSQPAATREKIHFIHFNHTNPLMWDDSSKNTVTHMHFNLCRQGEVL